MRTVGRQNSHLPAVLSSTVPDFQPIARVGEAPLQVLAANGVPANTLGELIASDLGSNSVQLFIDAGVAALQHVSAGRMKVLAITTAGRSTDGPAAFTAVMARDIERNVALLQAAKFEPE
jgi:tripartite-type tricarboxylate transporter receptor subunit TctC